MPKIRMWKDTYENGLTLEINEQLNVAKTAIHVSLTLMSCVPEVIQKLHEKHTMVFMDAIV